MKKIPSLSDPQNPLPKMRTPYPQNQNKRKVNILTNKHRIDQNAILLKNSIFFKNYSNDFDNFWSECRGERYRPAEKNRTSKACSVLEIFIHKVGIFGQNGQTEVQRSSNNSRTVNDMKNLIRYSESAENSLSPMCHQILPSSTS